MKRDSSSLVTTLVEEYVHNYKLSLEKKMKKKIQARYGALRILDVCFSTSYWVDDREKR